MEGASKQVALAEIIKAQALESLQAAGLAAPLFMDACKALSEAVSAVNDAAWIIENRYNLGLKTNVIYGTQRPTITVQEALYHQLLRNEHWREPRLRKGISNFTKVRQAEIKAMFQEAWRLERL